jgi:hypothetical protein
VHRAEQSKSMSMSMSKSMSTSKSMSMSTPCHQVAAFLMRPIRGPLPAHPSQGGIMQVGGLGNGAPHLQVKVS